MICSQRHLVVCHLQYIDTTITQMSEAWEDILLEMDSKLKKLAEDKYVSFENILHVILYRNRYCYVLYFLFLWYLTVLKSKNDFIEAWKVLKRNNIFVSLFSASALLCSNVYVTFFWIWIIFGKSDCNLYIYIFVQVMSCFVLLHLCLWVWDAVF